MARVAPALLVAIALAAAPAVAQPALQGAAAHGPRVTVTGEGHVSAVPDLASLDVAVVTTAADPAAALSENAARMRTTEAAFKAAGIAERDIATSGFSVTPQYASDDGRAPAHRPPRITGYTVRNEVTIKVRDLGKLGSVMSAAVGQGANSVGSLAFSLADPQHVVDQARQKAVEDARHRATLYAEALGLKLGPLVALTDRGGGVPRPVPMFAARAMAAPPTVPISPGEREVSASVTAVWRLQPK
jgi:uncharacterized protein YggE